MRYRLRTLLIVLTWIGLACLALRTPTQLWSVAFTYSTLLAFLISVLVIIYRRGRMRAFAAGFLLFGVSSLAFTIGGGWLGMTASGDPLSYLAEMPYRQIHGDPTARGHDWSQYIEFLAIIRYGSAFLMGVLGGVIAQMLYAPPREVD